MFRSFIQSRMALACAAAIMVVGIQVADAKAAFTYRIYGTNEFSGSLATFGGYIDATFENNGTDNVKLTLTTVNATDGEGFKFEGFYFNLAGLAAGAGNAPVTITSIGTLPFSSWTPNYGNNSYQPDGDGQFDLLLNFPNGNFSTVFNVNETATFNISGSGLTEASFHSVSVNGPVGKNGFYVVARVISLENGEGSGWFYGQHLNPVPAPPAIILAVSGVMLCGLGGLVRRFRRSPLSDAIAA